MMNDFEDEQPIIRIPQNEAGLDDALGKKILLAAQDYLENISEKEHAFLIQTLRNLAKEEIYFDVLADELDQPVDSKFANDALNLLHFWPLIHQFDDLTNFQLLDVVNGESFQKDLLVAFDALKIGEHKLQRRTVILEALKLYKLKCYAGCIAILYAQIEGLLTDILIEHGYLQQKQTKFIDVYKIVPGLKGSEIKSLWHKAKIASELNPYFAELAAYKMDSDSTITMTRHNILHGTDMNHLNQERSFILFLWLFSVISFMSTLKK